MAVTSKILSKLHYDDGKSLRQIAKILGLSYSQLRYIFVSKFNMKPRQFHKNKWEDIFIPKEKLIKLYYNDGLSLRDISKLFNTSPFKVSDLMEEYGLDRRYHLEYTDKRLERVKGTSKFCDQYKENNPNWKGGITFKPYPFEFNLKYRSLIRERDGNKCRMCGTTSIDNGRNMQVHHIDMDKSNNSPDNLISLCNVCHGTVHNNENMILLMNKNKGVGLIGFISNT